MVRGVLLGLCRPGLDCLGLALQYADAQINDSCQGLSIGFDLRIFLHQLIQHCLDLSVDQTYYVGAEGVWVRQ